jgi:3-deoxy-manno-octulosonate cytidylyltransferase (CMP-KDO synthetase)
VLQAYPALPVSPLENAEQLEQLRFLDAGYRFQTVETDYRPIAVDVADDLERVRALIGK